MSMPFIIPGFGTRERAITDIIESTALQKTALAHILNAEGEKIQAAIIRPGVTVDNLIAVNDSVQAMIYGVTRLELVLEAKLTILSDLSVLDTFLPDLPIAPLIPIVPSQTDSTDKTLNNTSTDSTGKTLSNTSTGSIGKTLSSGNTDGALSNNNTGTTGKSLSNDNTDSTAAEC